MAWIYNCNSRSKLARFKIRVNNLLLSLYKNESVNPNGDLKIHFGCFVQENVLPSNNSSALKHLNCFVNSLQKGHFVKSQKPPCHKLSYK
jgi:hypothetical protein